MRILYSAFDPVPWPKGSGTRIEATVRALAKAGAQVRLHTPKPAYDIPGFPSLLEVEGVEHQPVGIHGDNFLERALAFRDSVELVVASESFDGAIFRSPWEGMPISKGIPRCAFEVHGFPSIELPHHHPGIEQDPQFLDRLIGEENACLAKARLFVTPSITNRHFLMRRGVHPAKIHIVPNTVSLEEIPEQPTLAPEGPPFRVGYMGTLAPWQGLGTLLEAVSLLKRRYPCKLVVAGTRKGRWIREIRQLAGLLGVKSCLEIHGPLPKGELFEVLGSCHVLAAPLPNDPRNGLQGCCPIKLLEYMTLERAIVSTRIPPVRELLTDEETGILVKPGSGQSLAIGLQRAFEDPALRKQVAKRAKEVVMERFHRGQFERQITAFLDELRLLSC